MITYTTDKLQKVLLSGGCEQNGTPSPENPIDIVCNNGAIKKQQNMFIASLSESNKSINSKTGEVVTQNNYTASGFIKVTPGVNYTCTGFYPGLQAALQGLAYYDSSMQYVSGIPYVDLTVNNVTIPSGVQFIRFPIRNASTPVSKVIFYPTNRPIGTIYADGVQEVVTDSLGNMASAEKLLAVGDYKDTQEVLSGNVTRNIGVKVLDGTEEWIKGVADNNNFCYFDADVINKNTTTELLCSHYGIVAPNIKENNTVCVRLNKNGFLITDNIHCTTSKEWAQFLANQYNAGTPVIIVYLLATPTTERVTPQPLAGNSVTQTAGSISNLPIESSTIAELKKRYVGNNKVARVFIGNNKVWETDDL